MAVLIMRRYVLSISLAAICFVFLMATVPIKWTPVIAIIPEYSTWHEVNSVHLMKVLWHSLPSGVTPVKNCSATHKPSMRRTHMARYKIKAFSYKSVEASMRTLMKEDNIPDLSHFLPLLNKETKTTLLYTYIVLVQALKKINVSHVLLHGSLLGVHRFTGVQPWDDDLDIAINVTKWRQVRDVLSCIDGFELLVDPTMRWSFFPSNGPPSVMPGKKYPFIDIFFQAEDDTHVWGLHWNNRRRSLFPKALMFPISWNYLDGIRVPVPHKPKEILQSQYGDLNLCSSQEYGHLVASKSVHTIPCSLLFPVYGNFSSPS